MHLIIPTFKTEALQLVSNVQLVKRHLLRNEWQIQHYLVLCWQEFMTHFITKTTPISNVNSKYRIKKLKSSRTYLADWLFWLQWISIAWDTHIHKYTYKQTCIPTSRTKQNQASLPNTRLV